MSSARFGLYRLRHDYARRRVRLCDNFQSGESVLKIVIAGAAIIPTLILVVSAYSQAPPATQSVEAQLSAAQTVLLDWPNLSRYRDQNAKLPPPGPSEDRVVFMGDSITDAWGRERGIFFPGKPYVNRGISGQTTPQMLVRFRPDVIALKPRVVVILAGTNDIAGNTGPETLEDIEGNLATMVQLAQANGMHVVLASVMPVCDYIQPQTVRRPPEKISALNAWIKTYAAANNAVYLDYYSAMVDQNGRLKKELTFDGLHPNDAGYDVMGPLAFKAIAIALTAK
jgi:lysophospholipase L1-like esterase